MLYQRVERRSPRHIGDPADWRKIFWTSGLVKLQNWTISLYLSAHEYPVSWLDPVTAAWLGEAIELVCPPLLVVGLATRFAALPMLILSLVIQFSFQALDQHLFWAVLFTWFVVKGAGPISLDALIGTRRHCHRAPVGGYSYKSQISWRFMGRAIKLIRTP